MIGASTAYAALISNCAEANGDLEFTGNLALATDYRFRGVSQSRNAPAAQACLEVEHKSGWFAYVWASNVDFVAGGDEDDGARAEIDIALGYERALSERVSVSANYVRYFYPGTKEGIDYGYDELIASFVVDDRHRLTAGYAPDVFASGEAGLFIAAGTRLDVPGGLALSAEIGHYDLQAAYGESYNYGSAAISGGGDRLTWQLAYYVTSREARTLFDESIAAPTLVLSLHLPL